MKNGSSDGARPRRPRIQSRRFAGTRSFAERLERPLRIAHLTDQHVGLVTPMAVQREAIRLINEAEPDLVLLTGDYVCHSLDYLDHLRMLLRELRAPKYGVLGNHDHWAGANEVRGALRDSEVEVLDNAWTEVSVRGQKLRLVGLDDAYTSHADRERATRGLDRSVPAVGLSHIAEEADALWHAGVPLVLSGHTHSGQFTLAGLHRLTLGRLGGHRYVHGLYGDRKEQQQPGAVYVSAGIGAAVVGMRLGERARREVAFFELGEQPGAFEEHHTEQAPLPGRPIPEKVRLKRVMQIEQKRARRESKTGKA